MVEAIFTHMKNTTITDLEIVAREGTVFVTMKFLKSRVHIPINQYKDSLYKENKVNLM